MACKMPYYSNKICNTGARWWLWYNTIIHAQIHNREKYLSHVSSILTFNILFTWNYLFIKLSAKYFYLKVSLVSTSTVSTCPHFSLYVWWDFSEQKCPAKISLYTFLLSDAWTQWDQFPAKIWKWRRELQFYSRKSYLGKCRCTIKHGFSAVDIHR